MANNATTQKLIEQRMQMVENISDADLARLMSSGADFRQLHEAMLSLRETLREPEQSAGRKPVALSAGFPDAEYSFCGSTHKAAAGLLAAQVVLDVAKGVWDSLNRFCEQVVIAAGFGGNASVPCVAADLVLNIAIAVFHGVEFCENDIDSAEITGSYKRLAHIHDDLASMGSAFQNSGDSNRTAIVTNDNSNKTEIVANDNSNREAIVSVDNSNKTAIIANDNSNKEAIIANDNSNKEAIIANDNSNKEAIIANDNNNRQQIITNDNNNRQQIITNDNNNKTAIIANDNSNKEAIIANDNNNRQQIITNDNNNRDLIISNALRLAIEHVLSGDHGSAVAFFQLPAPAGHLDLVRSIVRQTIDNMKAAGQSLGNAEKFYQEAITLIAGGSFKEAFKRFQQAYEQATK